MHMCACMGICVLCIPGHCRGICTPHRPCIAYAHPADHLAVHLSPYLTVPHPHPNVAHLAWPRTSPHLASPCRTLSHVTRPDLTSPHIPHHILPYLARAHLASPRVISPLLDVSPDLTPDRAPAAGTHQDLLTVFTRQLINPGSHAFVESEYGYVFDHRATAHASGEDVPFRKARHSSCLR